MGKCRSLENQMKHACSDAMSLGEQKRRYARANNGETNEKVFGLKYAQDLYKTMGQLCYYLKTNCPEVRWVKDIRQEHLQGFLQEKSNSCNINTLGKIKSHIGKLEKICKAEYGRMDWKADKLALPAIIDCPADLKTYVATKTDYLKTKADMQDNGRSEAWKAVVLSRYAGLRVNETAEVKIGRFTPTGGKWGCGTVTLQGKEDGTKGGRWRTVDILTPEARTALAEAFEERSGGVYVIQQTDGSPLKPDSITRALERSAKRTGVDLPKYNRNHSYRKLFAQESYDAARATGMTKREALDYANHQLGHGDNRKDLSDRYVQNQW